MMKKLTRVSLTGLTMLLLLTLSRPISAQAVVSTPNPQMVTQGPNSSPKLMAQYVPGPARPEIRKAKRLNDAPQGATENTRVNGRGIRGVIKIAIFVVIGVITLGGWLVRKLGSQ